MWLINEIKLLLEICFRERCMGESFQDQSLIQDFEADFP